MEIFPTEPQEHQREGWEQSTFQFIPEVFGGGEVRVLCRKRQFCHSKLCKPCLHGAALSCWSIFKCFSSSNEKSSSIQRYYILVCVSKFLAKVRARNALSSVVFQTSVTAGSAWFSQIKTGFWKTPIRLLKNIQMARKKVARLHLFGGVPTAYTAQMSNTARWHTHFLLIT